MKKNVCACIITYNIDEKINEVVNSIINQVDLVVIVDNASKSDTLEILKKLNENDKVHIIFNKVNNGIAIALNQGIKVAKDKKMEWIMTLDHDSICDENMVKNMFEVNNIYSNEEKVAILAPQVFEMHKQDFISNKNNSDYYTEVKECIQSGSLFKISVFDKIGYFNEDLFIIFVQLYSLLIRAFAFLPNSFILSLESEESINLAKFPSSLVKYTAPSSPTSLLNPTSNKILKSVVAKASNNDGLVPPTSCPWKYP